MNKTNYRPPNVFIGTLNLNSKGVGYVTPPESTDRMHDVEIQNNLLNKALNRDEVEVKLLPQKIKDRLQGEIISIKKETKRTFVGVLDVTATGTFLIPDDKKMYRDISIPEKVFSEKHGYKALVEITEWTDAKKNPIGKILDILGKKGEHEAEMQSIIREKGIIANFPTEVEAEAHAIEKQEKPIPEVEIKKRRDIRDTFTCTIDPYDAKDFDDAISFKTLPNGNYEIGVHIADVSHYVREGTALDAEAKERSFSVYLVDRTIPMLPEVLSNDLCSLNPKEDKLAFSSIFIMTPQGKVIERWFGKTVINSDKRFTYEEAQGILDAKSGEFFEELNTLNKLAYILRAEKFAAGAIDFDSEEIKFKLDEHGKPLEIIKKQRLDTHKLVEEYMLLSNREVAEFMSKELSKQGIKDMDAVFLYRIHDVPDADRFADLSMFARALGFKMEPKAKATAKQISSLINQAQGTNHATLIKTAAIRSMAKAIYSVNNIGHFGLAFEHYTHFTSPIRRYADLIVHRLLNLKLEGKNISQGALAYYAKLSGHMTDREISAADAERTSIKYKQVEFLQDKIGKIFKGTITSVTEWGIYVEDPDTKAEGMISLRELTDDFYEYKEKEYALVGQKTKKRFALGDIITVKLVKTDLERKTIDLALVKE